MVDDMLGLKCSIHRDCCCPPSKKKTIVVIEIPIITVVHRHQHFFTTALYNLNYDNKQTNINTNASCSSMQQIMDKPDDVVVNSIIIVETINNKNNNDNSIYTQQCKSIDQRSTTRHPSENERKTNRHDIYSNRLTLLDAKCNVIFSTAAAALAAHNGNSGP